MPHGRSRARRRRLAQARTVAHTTRKLFDVGGRRRFAVLRRRAALVADWERCGTATGAKCRRERGEAGVETQSNAATHARERRRAIGRLHRARLTNAAADARCGQVLATKRTGTVRNVHAVA